MADYKKYLAASILTEDKTVTYRLLSRALKVHVNTAKEMLYEFHRQQNAKQAGSIHATYILSGTKRDEQPEAVPVNGQVRKDGEDEYMQSSPFVASSMPHIEDNGGAASVLNIALVREHDLEEVKSAYTEIQSIHIYSLSPGPIKDLQVLSDITRQLKTLNSDESTKAYTACGGIINPLVRRRTNQRPLLASVAPAVVKSAARPAQTVKTEAPKIGRQDSDTANGSQSSSAMDFFGKGKEKSTIATGTGVKNTTTSSKESTPTPAPPANLKRQSSNIFKAFAKTKEPVKKQKEEQEDVAMSDDGDDDGEEPFAPPIKDEAEVAKDRKSRKEREDALRKMMDDESDEEEDGKIAPTTETVKQEDVEMQDEDQDVKIKPPIKQEDGADSEPTVTVSDGRRRGKRKVMKKKTEKDEEGYLVTREEAVWESFSEDEPVPKPKPKSQPTSSANVKAKKSAGKPGQGNIMSFFGKK